MKGERGGERNKCVSRKEKPLISLTEKLTDTQRNTQHT